MAKQQSGKKPAPTPAKAEVPVEDPVVGHVEADVSAKELEEIAQERAKLDAEKAKLEQMRAEFEERSKVIAASVAPVTPLGEMFAKELDELRRLKTELMLTLASAKAAVAPAKPEKILNPLESRLSEHVIAPIPLGFSEPPPGSVKKLLRVTLPHCASRVVEIWVVPGTELMIRDLAVKAFNEVMGVISSDHQHAVSEEGSEPLDTAASAAPKPSAEDDGRDLSDIRNEMLAEQQPTSVLEILRDELNAIS